MDCSLPGSIHEVLQERILEWVAISFSRGSSRPGSPALQADAFTVGATREAQQCIRIAKPAKWHALNGEMGTDTYTLLILCIKRITSEKLLYSSGNSTLRRGDLNRKEIQKRGCVCVCVELLHFAAQQKLTRRKAPSRSVVSDALGTPRAVAHQAPLSAGFSS